jgi:hypothetical protein
LFVGLSRLIGSCSASAFASAASLCFLFGYDVRQHQPLHRCAHCARCPPLLSSPLADDPVCLTHTRDHARISTLLASRCLPPLPQIIWDIAVDQQRTDVDENLRNSMFRALPVFRAVGAMLFIPWLWAIDVSIWRTVRVNYQFLLDSDIKASPRPREVCRYD